MAYKVIMYRAMGCQNEGMHAACMTLWRWRRRHRLKDSNKHTKRYAQRECECVKFSVLFVFVCVCVCVCVSDFLALEEETPPKRQQQVYEKVCTEGVRELLFSMYVCIHTYIRI